LYAVTQSVDEPLGARVNGSQPYTELVHDITEPDAVINIAECQRPAQSGMPKRRNSQERIGRGGQAEAEAEPGWGKKDCVRDRPNMP